MNCQTASSKSWLGKSSDERLLCQRLNRLDNSTIRILLAVLVKCHRRRSCDVIAVRQAPDGDFYDVVDQRQQLLRQTGTFVTDHQCGATVERVVVQVLRVA